LRAWLARGCKAYSGNVDEPFASIGFSFMKAERALVHTRMLRETAAENRDEDEERTSTPKSSTKAWRSPTRSPRSCGLRTASTPSRSATPFVECPGRGRSPRGLAGTREALRAPRPFTPTQTARLLLRPFEERDPLGVAYRGLGGGFCADPQGPCSSPACTDWWRAPQNARLHAPVGEAERPEPNREVAASFDPRVEHTLREVEPSSSGWQLLAFNVGRTPTPGIFSSVGDPSSPLIFARCRIDTAIAHG
jgi:hypothetical protein